MRRRVLALVVIAALAAAVVPALAADDATITARNFYFDPDGVTIHAGDTVTFAIDASVGHNFDFGDGEVYPDAPTGPGPAWNDLKKTFSKPPRRVSRGCRLEALQPRPRRCVQLYERAHDAPVRPRRNS
jgi:plastocyanin